MLKDQTLIETLHKLGPNVIHYFLLHVLGTIRPIHTKNQRLWDNKAHYLITKWILVNVFDILRASMGTADFKKWCIFYSLKKFSFENLLKMKGALDGKMKGIQISFSEVWKSRSSLLQWGLFMNKILVTKNSATWQGIESRLLA